MRYLSGTLGLKVIVVGALLGAWLPADAYGQLLYSFENGLEGWGQSDSNSALSITQSTQGATQGTHSMAVEVGPNFTDDAKVSADATVMGAIAATANTGKKYDLRTDVTFTADSWSGLATPPGFFVFNMESNSNGGFQRHTLFSVPANTVRTFHSMAPLENFFPTPDNLGFAQFRTGKNDNHVNGTSGLKYYVDNMRIQEITETQLFSWEGSFDDWENGFSGQAYQHQRSLVTDYGVTSGTGAMQIIEPQSGFAWGSQIVLNTPAEQAQLDTIAAGLNQADAIRFDVTIPNDHFGTLVAAGLPGAPPPSFLNVTLNVSDNTFAFYQSFDRSINPTEGVTTTVTIPLDELRANGTDLKAAGFQGNSFLRFALATNAGGPAVFAIDNWRLIKSVVPGVPGDYNQNGIVDAADFVVWRNNIGPNTIPNDPTPGTVDASDYTFWKGRFGANSASGSALATSVPEPTTLCAGMIAVLAGCWGQLRRRSRG